MRIDPRGEVSVAKNGDTEWTAIEVDLVEPISGMPDTGFSRGFVSFAPKIVEAIRSGARSIEHAATFEDGVMVQRVLDAARESNARGMQTIVGNRSL